MGYATKPCRSWFQFGYPIGYVTDMLQNLEVLTALGYGDDPRLEPALKLLVGKQDNRGRWRMEYTYNGKTWADVEQKVAQQMGHAASAAGAQTSGACVNAPLLRLSGTTGVGDGERSRRGDAVPRSIP